MDMKDIKENLAKVDKRIWVAIGCGILFLAVFSFVSFTNIGRTLLMVAGSILFNLLLLAGCYKLYVVILKKLDVEKVPADIDAKLSFKMVVNDKSKIEPEVIEFEVDTFEDDKSSECAELEAENTCSSQKNDAESKVPEAPVVEEKVSDTEVEATETSEEKA